MLSVKTSSTSPLTAVLPTAAVQAHAPETNPAQPSFAKMLHDNQAPAARPATETKAPAQSQAHAAPAHTPPAAAPRPAQAAHEPAPARETARPTAKSGEAQDAAAAPHAVDGKAESEAEDKDNDGGDTSVVADPALADWLAGLNLPGPSATAVPLATPTADASTGTPALRADAPPAAGTASQLTATSKDAAQAAVAAAAGNAAIVIAGGAAALGATAAGGRSDTNGPTATGTARHTDTGARGAARDGNDTSLLALATKAEAPGGQPGTSTGSGDAGNPDRSAQTPVWSPITSIAPASSAPTAFMPVALNALSPQTGSNAPQPLAVSLPTPLYSPEFPQAMSAQLTVLAQGGVEQAELHLNPAEMGPVSVQIAIEGTQARIDFGADSANTRQAIEASLPELASALRDAGLTLSGGGVSQHSRSRQDMADAQGATGGRGNVGSRGDGGAGIDSVAAAPLRRSVRIGGVDAYA